MTILKKKRAVNERKKTGEANDRKYLNGVSHCCTDKKQKTHYKSDSLDRTEGKTKGAASNLHSHKHISDPHGYAVNSFACSQNVLSKR